MHILVIIFIMATLLFLKGFFSGSEIALVNADKLKLTHQANHGQRGAQMVLRLFRTPEVLLTTTLVGMRRPAWVAEALAVRDRLGPRSPSP